MLLLNVPSNYEFNLKIYILAVMSYSNTSASKNLLEMKFIAKRKGSIQLEIYIILDKHTPNKYINGPKEGI